MVRPVRFGYNEQTAKNNAFQHVNTRFTAEELQEKALAEFDVFVDLLRSIGVTVSVFEDQYQPHTPDSIFPNNWISFHQDGSIVLYPMFAPNRRLERRADIVDHFAKQIPGVQLIDLSHYEAEGLFLEGTGSMILDRQYRKVYACISARTSPELFHKVCAEWGYEGLLFHSTDEAGIEVYHTNVMMALGERLTVICLESIRDPQEREQICTMLAATGKEILPLTFAQMNAFAGNMLEVFNQAGQSVWVMSQRAFDSLDATQLATLRAQGEILVIPLDVIETYGGGSVRCMMAEVII